MKEGRPLSQFFGPLRGKKKRKVTVEHFLLAVLLDE